MQNPILTSIIFIYRGTSLEYTNMYLQDLLTHWKKIAIVIP